MRAASLSLDDAKAIVACEYAFSDWPALLAFAGAVGEPAVAAFERAVEAVIDGDQATLNDLLQRDPDLVRARSARRHRATLLHYIAGNGVEGYRQRTPPNAVDIARLLLDRGADPDALAEMYGEQCTTMSMLVSSSPPHDAGLQAKLAETLLDYGASLDGAGSKWRSPVLTALQFGFLDTARALIRRGVGLTTVSIAAGLGNLEEVKRLLPHASPGERHAALALAAQHGHVDIVRQLLDAGEDPDRYNPDGFHAHSTPLHQAALANHLDVVRLLVERGATTDRRDKIYSATPLGWAEYARQDAVAKFLRGESGG